MPIDETYTEFVRTVVADKLTAQAEKLGLSLRRAAASAGVSDSMIAKFRGGDCDYSLANLLLVLFAHKLTLKDIADELTPEKVFEKMKHQPKVQNREVKDQIVDATQKALARLSELNRSL